MPKPRQIHDYPQELFDFCQSACEQPGGVQLQFPSASDAIRYRMQVYNFRRVVARAIESGELDSQWARSIGQLMLTIDKLPDGSVILKGCTMSSYYAWIGDQLRNQGVYANLQPRPPVNLEAQAKASAARLLSAEPTDGSLMVTSDQEPVSQPADDHEDAVARWLSSAVADDTEDPQSSQ